jgi:DNA (cytosine-5)-methyltransferase 1
MTEHLGQSVSRRPRLFDLCCGAGGAGEGYRRVGFDVVGIDIEPQPHYPFEFHRRDMLALTLADFAGFDAIHASPPCQRYSAMSSCRPGLAAEYPDLIEQARWLAQRSGLPYVIENVPGSPLHDPVVLCGAMFGRALYRHRLFESNFPIATPSHPEHVLPASKAGHWRPGTVMSVAGHFAPVAKAREIMDIDWMNRAELGEAIPPYYAEHVGGCLMAACGLARAA